MHRSLLLTVLAVGACIAVSIPDTSSLPLQRPPASLSIPLSSTNNTGIIPHNWPHTPWTRDLDPFFITFQSYGRLALLELEYDIFTGMQDIYEQVKSGSILPNYPNLLHGGIVSFYLLFQNGGSMTAEEIGRVLVDIQALFLNHMYGPREIQYASVSIGRRNIATFQILFTRVMALGDGHEAK